MIKLNNNRSVRVHIGSHSLKSVYITALALCTILNAGAQSKKVDLDVIRANYSKAVVDKKLCSQMLDDLSAVKNTPIYLAYLGGLQTIWANHVYSPITKLATFKEGKRNIEKAVLKEPANAEIRFVRFSVQKNAPSFLGYTSNLKEDSAFLKSHKNEIHSDIVLETIEKLLTKKANK